MLAMVKAELTMSASSRVVWLLAIAAGLTIGGCSSLQYAGVSAYDVSPFTGSDGKTTCCAVHIRDGKESQSLVVHLIKHAEDYDISFSRNAETAFAGQSIAAGAGQAAVSSAAKVAAAAALAPALPALLPSAGAALAAPGIGAAAAGGLAVYGAQQLAK
jgi:hypothetical protein